MLYIHENDPEGREDWWSKKEKEQLWQWGPWACERVKSNVEIVAGLR